MEREDLLRMKPREIKRLHLIHQALEQKISQKQAAEIAELSARQMRRLMKRVETEGDRGILHRRRGMPSNLTTTTCPCRRDRRGSSGVAGVLSRSASGGSCLRTRVTTPSGRHIAPDTPLLYRFALPTANHVFLPGHRVMVQVQSSWFPLYDRNPQTIVPSIFWAKSGDYRKAVQRIYHAPDRTSFIEMPLVVTP